MTDPMGVSATLESLSRRVQLFRDERDWKQFHTDKDMVLALFLEVSELAEHVLWKNPAEFSGWLNDNRSSFGEELADILYWVLLLAHDCGINLAEAFQAKMEQNSRKYPVEQARGKKHKYTHYQQGQD